MKTKSTNQELEFFKRNNNFKSFLDIAGVIFVGIDINGIVILVNKKACEIF